MPKSFTKPYDYIHGANGIRYHGLIEADTPEELHEHMQAELDASGGTLAAATFTSPDLLEPLIDQVPSVAEVLAERLEEANARLKTAGLPEVEIPPDVKAVIDLGVKK